MCPVCVARKRDQVDAHRPSLPPANTVETPDTSYSPSTPEVRDAARTAATTNAVAPDAPPARPRRTLGPIATGLASFGAGVLVCLVAYLAVSVPGSWFPNAPRLQWDARDMALTRGAGYLDDRGLVVTAPDTTTTTLILIATDFRSADYRAIAWSVFSVPDQAEVWMLWRTDLAPDKLNTVPVSVVSGRLRPVEMASQPNWLGHVKGIALAVRGQLPQPLRVRRVEAKPMGALEVLRDRAGEWLTFEGWTGTSINTLAGGYDVQDLPLPVVLATAVALAALGLFIWLRRSAQPWKLPVALTAVFVAAWFVADARWQWNLARQAEDTQSRYGGKDWRGKHLAAEDAAVFVFVDKVLAKLPPPPARVFVVADAHYLRDRAAYLLYPHNVFFDPYQNSPPPTGVLRSGDYLVVYQRRGIQYDPGQQQLRVAGGAPMAAELLLAEQGSALFRIR